MIQRKIPSSGEEIPVLGLGTWQTFDVGKTKPSSSLLQVLETMKQSGGKLIDSSPMYGNAEEMVGSLTSNAAWSSYFFYATKVWTTGKQAGINQMETSFQKMKRETMDLMQIHNLTDYKTHLQTLKEWKAEGRVRYIGITHYTDTMHGELERIILSETIDFVQFNYSILSRNAEKSLLGVATDRGVATIINKPFGEGKLFQMVNGRPLPPWAAELNIHSWSAYFLKYIMAHPAVTCVIPATGNPEHAVENYTVATDISPDLSLKRKMIEYVNSL